MTFEQKEWSIAREDLVHTITSLGFPEELGNEIAKTLGSPKAIRRMISYLHQVRPNNVEIVVDEMLAIRAEIDAWSHKKDAQEANAKYNEMRYSMIFGVEEYKGGL